MRARVILGAAAAVILLAGPLAAEPAAKTAKVAPNNSVKSSGTSGPAAGAPPAPAAKAASDSDVKVAATSADADPKPKAEKARPVHPTLKASINLSSQTMTVSEHGKTKYVWKISSGRRGYHTPRGTYRPQWLSRMHYSRKYDNAPMPHSVFFHGGYAIHATYATGALGRPASHGCVRLSPSHAKTFYRLVGRHGKARTRITVTGSTPSYKTYAKRKKTHRKTYTASGGWGGIFWAPASPKPKKYKKVRRKPSAKPNYNYSYYKPKYSWPGD